jgi:hypothetical protein
MWRCTCKPTMPTHAPAARAGRAGASLRRHARHHCQRLALYYEVTSPILAWYRDRGILVSVAAMRSAQQVGREILAALEAMRPFLDHVPGQARLSVDLTGLGNAFGATGPATSTSS